MAKVLIVSSLLLLITNIVSGRDLREYTEERNALSALEIAGSLGGKLNLVPDEILVNTKLMEAKKLELRKGFLEPAEFPPARNFLNSKKDIEKSAVFDIIKRMPKGATLHAHSTAIVSDEFIFTNLTYLDNLYVCTENDQLRFHFFKTPESDCKWELLSGLRKDPTEAELINGKIRKELSMHDPSTSTTQFRDGNAVWTTFENVFRTLSGLIKYRLAHEKYFYQGLQELYNDNVMYLEIRAGLGTVYDLDGTKYSTVEVARMYKDTTERFVRDHPDFLGVKLIYAPYKTDDIVKLNAYMENIEALKAADFGGFFVGFDFVGQEDNVPPLLNIINKRPDITEGINMFFHAGETNWSGMEVDENLIDAVLLNTKRIGHGYALLKHPKLLEAVREKQIAIEICPISNQVLHLVQDLRNHPANALFADNDFPVVVSNDDPGFWGAQGLSYDFYEAFMGMMSAHADIRALKQLAMNSIKFSALNAIEKETAMSMWTNQWNKFIESEKKKP